MVQNSLSWIADILDYIHGLLHWEDFATTRIIVVILVISCVLFSLVSVKHWLVGLGLLLMSCQTYVFSLLLQVIFGLVQAITAIFYRPNLQNLDSRKAIEHKRMHRKWKAGLAAASLAQHKAE
jgi:hypothetical protein